MKKKKAKAYTSLEQSKKLSEILPLESADMEYLAIKENGELVGCVPFVKDDSEVVEDSAYNYTYDRISCWSLAALLGVLPSPFLSELNFEIWKCGCYPSGICYYVAADSPIDACYEMIVKLHELKKL